MAVLGRGDPPLNQIVDRISPIPTDTPEVVGPGEPLALL